MSLNNLSIYRTINCIMQRETKNITYWKCLPISSEACVSSCWHTWKIAPGTAESLGLCLCKIALHGRPIFDDTIEICLHVNVEKSKDCNEVKGKSFHVMLLFIRKFKMVSIIVFVFVWEGLSGNMVNDNPKACIEYNALNKDK